MSEAGYEREFVRQAFDTNWIAPLGENVTRFEQELATYVGSPAATALASGTAALHMALRAAGVGRGDIVLCQDLTFAASVNPIVYQGATPVLIDSDRTTWNMDPDLLERAFERYPQAKAVMVVHLYGLSADLDPIAALCRAHGVSLIEDAAESLGTKYKDRYTGTVGDYGAYSFNGNKIITTSGGGMLVSPHEDRIKKVLFWATQARDPAPHYQHSEIGYNYRLSNVSAGIGRGQLKVLDERIRQKRALFAGYRERLADLPGLSFMPQNDWNRSNCWLTAIQLNGDVTPAALMAALAEAGAETRPTWKPMHLQPVFSECDFFTKGAFDPAKGIDESVSADLFTHGLCLPSDTKMTTDELDFVADVIRRCHGA